MHGVQRRLATAVTLVAFAAPIGCAETYHPRPNGRIAFEFDAMNGYRITKNGKSETLGVSMNGLEEAVRENPRAAEEASSASSSSIGAIVAGAIGGGAAGAGGFLIGYDAARSGNRFPSATGDAGLALFGGALALVIASAVLRTNSQIHMFNAVNIYNDEVGPLPYAVPYGPAYGPVPAPGYQPLPGFQGPNWAPPPPAQGAPPPTNLAPPASPLQPPAGELPPVRQLPPGLLPPQPVPLGQSPLEPRPNGRLTRAA